MPLSLASCRAATGTPTARLHREFELAALTGRDEELLVARVGTRPGGAGHRGAQPLRAPARRHQPGASRGGAATAGRRPAVPAAAAAAGDLRRPVRATLVCPWPDCGERVSIEFAIVRRAGASRPTAGPVHTMTLSAPPTAATTARSASGCPTAPTRRSCRRMAGAQRGRGADRAAGSLRRRIGPTSRRTSIGRGAVRAARAEIEQRMRQLAPQVEQAMDASCAECGRRFTAPFDIQRFFFGELRTDGDLLYRRGALPGLPLPLERTRDHGDDPRQAADIHRGARRRDRGAQRWRLRAICAACSPTARGRSGIAAASRGSSGNRTPSALNWCRRGCQVAALLTLGPTDNRASMIGGVSADLAATVDPHERRVRSTVSDSASRSCRRARSGGRHCRAAPAGRRVGRPAGGRSRAACGPPCIGPRASRCG